MASQAHRLSLVILLCMGLLIANGCTQRLGDFTVISTKNVDVSGLKPGDRFAGEDCIWSVLLIPLGTPNWKNAMDQALEKGKGDIMVDIVVSYWRWGVLIVGQECVLMEGTVSQTSHYKR